MRICPENVYNIHRAHKSAIPPLPLYSRLKYSHTLSGGVLPFFFLFSPPRRSHINPCVRAACSAYLLLLHLLFVSRIRVFFWWCSLRMCATLCENSVTEAEKRYHNNEQGARVFYIQSSRQQSSGNAIEHDAQIIYVCIQVLLCYNNINANSTKALAIYFHV